VARKDQALRCRRIKEGDMDNWLPTLPWWTFVVRGAVAYLGLLVLMRLAGRHSFGEMSAFDILVLVLVGGTLRTAIVGNDNSLCGAFIGVATVLVIDRLFAVLATRSPAFNRLLEGRPSMLARNGQLLAGELRRHHVPMTVFERALRKNGITDVHRVAEARLEPNGKFTVVLRQDTRDRSRPAAGR
jgi:uncharacterized membrane protein YcaP (DUF421 family)